jgi:hypothetical protein
MMVTAMPVMCSHVLLSAVMLSRPATAAMGAAIPTRMAIANPIFAHHWAVFGGRGGEAAVAGAATLVDGAPPEGEERPSQVEDECGDGHGTNFLR